MKLNDVQLLNSGKASEEKLKQNIFLMRYWENARNLFCIHLPNNFELVGIEKLKIQFGPFEGEQFITSKANGLAVFHRNDFSYKSFLELSEIDRDRASLNYIEDSLIEICKKYDGSLDKLKGITDSADKVRDGNFEYFRVHKKTSKWNLSRTIKVTTELHFKKGGIDANLIVSNKGGNKLFSEKIIDSRIWSAVWFDLWRGYWDDCTFKIETRVGELFYETEGFDEKAI